MRVELKIDPGCPEPHAQLVVSRLTPSLQAAISLLERENEEEVLAAVRGGKTYILEPGTVELIRTEGRELVLYDVKKQRYLLNRPLYELQEQLNQDFVRISKSAIVNIRRIRHVEASFNGTMVLVMKSGLEEIISRNFRRQFKERLGL